MNRSVIVNLTAIILINCISTSHAKPNPGNKKRTTLITTTVKNAASTELSFGITPGDQLSVQAGLDKAINAGATRVVVPPGIYRLVSPPGSGSHIYLHDVSNLTIEAKGVTFLLQTDQQGINFSHCKNVTLRGCVIMHEIPPFTQGIIESVSADRKSIQVRIHAGYPGLDAPGRPANTTGYLFDRKTRQWKRGGLDYSTEKIDLIKNGVYDLHFGGSLDKAVEISDLIAFRGTGGQDIFLGDCAKMRIEDVTIRNGGGFCVHEADGDGDNYYRYTLTYGPIPAGGTEKPLIACNADAFHSSSNRHGPTLEKCRFEGMPDDGVPIHGSYSLVAAASDDHLIVSDRQFRVGDPIHLFNATCEYSGEAKVIAVKNLPDYHADQKSKLSRFANLSQRSFTELTLDKPVKAEFDWMVSNPNADGSNYIVRGCVIRNHRARGMLLKAENGLVENNLVDGSTIDGIVLSPELWWNEACYSRNVIIRNNTIRNCGYAMVGPWVQQAGALTVLGEGKGEPGHRNIVIENNTFEDNNGMNILIHSASDVQIKGNRFIRAQQQSSDRGKDSFDPTSLIYITLSNNVRLEKNTIVGKRPFGKAFVTITPTAHGVTEAK